MARTETQTRIYGSVYSSRDIRTINEKIRDQMARVDRREELTEFKKRSDYLCALAESPPWKEKFGRTIGGVLRVAREENRKTTDLANMLAVRRGWEADYHPPSEECYSGGGKVMYLSYKSPAPTRGRHRPRRRSVLTVAARYRSYVAQTRQAWRDEL